MDAIKILKNLGLEPKEAQVYQALLNLGKGSVLDISKQAQVKRPTTYLVLEDLKKKGLVSSTLFRGVKDYRITDLGSLKKHVKKQELAVRGNIAEMRKLYDNRKFKLRLRVYQSMSAVKTLLEKSLREKSPMHIIGNENEFTQHLGEYWDYYLKRSGQLNMRPRFKQGSHPVNLLVWNDKVAFVEFIEPIQLFAFRNQKFHNLYQKLWNNY